MKDRKETFSEIEDRIRDIPVVDISAMRIIKLLDDPKSNFDQICRKLSPGITAKFLEMANTAYYGRKVTNIEYAVRVLGYNRMKQILVVSILMDHFSRHSMPDNFDYQRFQRHARFCTELCRIFADIFEIERKEDLLTISMIHDIGKLAVAIFLRDEFFDILRLKEKGVPEIKAEEEILGLNHAELGAFILDKFGISKDITEVIEAHHSSIEYIPQDRNYILKMILKKSNTMADMFNMNEFGDRESSEPLFKEIILKGKEIKDNLIREQMRDKGYEEIFPLLLNSLSSHIIKNLTNYISIG